MPQHLHPIPYTLGLLHHLCVTRPSDDISKIWFLFLLNQRDIIVCDLICTSKLDLHPKYPLFEVPKTLHLKYPLFEVPKNTSCLHLGVGPNMFPCLQHPPLPPF